MRIGPKMEAAVSYVRNNPGCCILPVAQAIGPHGSIQYGYKAVHRAIEAKLIAYTVHNGRYSLHIPESSN